MLFWKCRYLKLMLQFKVLLWTLLGTWWQLLTTKADASFGNWVAVDLRNLPSWTHVTRLKHIPSLLSNVPLVLILGMYFEKICVRSFHVLKLFCNQPTIFASFQSPGHNLSRPICKSLAHKWFYLAYWAETRRTKMGLGCSFQRRFTIYRHRYD